MTTLYESAFAKINLTLDVIGKRDDGYHLIDSVFQSVSLCDKVTVEKSNTVSVTCDDSTICDKSNIAYKAAEKAMTEVYGIEPVPSRGGGSIPILADLQRILEIDPLLMGFGLERDTIHSPNESYLLKQLFAGMEAIALFYRYY